jgi:hypothetical protein
MLPGGIALAQRPTGVDSPGQRQIGGRGRSGQAQFLRRAGRGRGAGSGRSWGQQRAMTDKRAPCQACGARKSADDVQWLAYEKAEAWLGDCPHGCGRLIREAAAQSLHRYRQQPQAFLLDEPLCSRRLNSDMQ